MPKSLALKSPIFFFSSLGWLGDHVDDVGKNEEQLCDLESCDVACEL